MWHGGIFIKGEFNFYPLWLSDPQTNQRNNIKTVNGRQKFLFTALSWLPT